MLSIGNPGIGDYYIEFMKNIFRLSNGKAPVVCVSHAGHVTPPANVATPSTSSVTRVNDYLSLKGQVQHKLAYINEHIGPNVRLTLVGHSIGCYMILQLLTMLNEARIFKCLLLFPTIERIAASPQGKVTTPVLHYLRWMAPLIIYPLSYLIPDTIKLYLVKKYFDSNEFPLCAIEGTLKLLSPSAVMNILYLANIEMQTVVEADHQLIETHLRKLSFYYGASDHWCPRSYHDDMKKRFPEADIYLCSAGHEHAFVLKNSVEMADIVWRLLKGSSMD